MPLDDFVETSVFSAFDESFDDDFPDLVAVAVLPLAALLAVAVEVMAGLLQDVEGEVWVAGKACTAVQQDNSPRKKMKREFIVRHSVLIDVD